MLTYRFMTRGAAQTIGVQGLGYSNGRPNWFNLGFTSFMGSGTSRSRT
jgi:hypothetical protein